MVNTYRSQSARHSGLPALIRRNGCFIPPCSVHSFSGISITVKGTIVLRRDSRLNAPKFPFNTSLFRTLARILHHLRHLRRTRIRTRFLHSIVSNRIPDCFRNLLRLADRNHPSKRLFNACSHSFIRYVIPYYTHTLRWFQLESQGDNYDNHIQSRK